MRKDRRRAITVYRCIGGIPFSTSFGFLEELVMLERVVYALPGILLFPLLSDQEYTQKERSRPPEVAKRGESHDPAKTGHPNGDLSR